MTIVNLEWVTGEGFLAFYSPFEFHISNYEGKALQIDGRNESDEKAQSNGAGKSGLIEAIGWGWYGELCRKGRYKDEVIYNRNGVKAKEAIVITQFKTEKNHIRTERSLEWKKSPELHLYDMTNYLPETKGEILKGATYQTKQEYLEQILGMNFIAFQCSQIFGGPTSSFICFPDLKPAERAKVLTDIRGLEKYVVASKRSGELSKEALTHIATKTEELRTIEGRIAQLREIDYKGKIREFEEEREKKIRELEAEEKKVKEQLKEFEKKQESDIKTLEIYIKNYEKEIIEITKDTQKYGEFEKKYKGLLDKKIDLKSNHKTLINKYSEAQQELTSMQKLKVGVCPKCKQKITGEHLKKEIAELNRKNLELFGQAKEAGAKCEEVEKELSKIDEKLTELADLKMKIQETQDLIHETKINVLSLQKAPEAERHRFTLTNLKNTLQAQRTAQNPYEKQEKERKATLFTLVGQSKGVKQAIEDLNLGAQYYQFWVEGFKKIRMSLFNTMINRFQDYAQNLLSQYSSELQVQFKTERETRSGTTKDEFDIIITDSSGTSLSYEMYSGGERQKVRLSIARALGEMIKDDCGKDFNFMVFDEPNDALDGLGKETNFEMFTQLAEDGKAVLVTDHDALFKDKFDISILVVKEDDKAYIKEGV